MTEHTAPPARGDVELFHRKAGPADVAELVRLRQLIFEGHPDEHRTDWLAPCEEYFRRRLASSDDDFCATVVAERETGGRLAACAVGWIDSHLPSPVSASGALGYVGSVATDKEYRGEGLGAAVFEALMDWFEEKRIPRVELQTTPDAVKLYRNRGFDELPTPVLRWYRPTEGAQE